MDILAIAGKLAASLSGACSRDTSSGVIIVYLSLKILIHFSIVANFRSLLCGESSGIAKALLSRWYTSGS